MKNLIFISLNICLFLCSCKKNEHCVEIEKPSNLKPINFEDYNDVHTVYWNYLAYCDETDPNPGDFIKVWGWLTNYYLPSTGQFFVHSQIAGDHRRKSLHIFLPVDEGNRLALKLGNTQLPVKCFIFGEVKLPCLAGGSCRKWVTVSLNVKNADDIYFE